MTVADSMDDDIVTPYIFIFPQVKECLLIKFQLQLNWGTSLQAQILLRRNDMVIKSL